MNQEGKETPRVSKISMEPLSLGAGLVITHFPLNLLIVPSKPEGGPEKIFGVNWFGGKVASSRFRIRLRRRQCMHVRAFELFGTILPRSNPDPAPPSPEEASVHTTEMLDDN